MRRLVIVAVTSVIAVSAVPQTAVGQIVVCFPDVPGDCSGERSARAKVDAARTPEERAAATRRLEKIQRETALLGEHRAAEARRRVEMRERAENARAGVVEAQRRREAAEAERREAAEAESRDRLGPNSDCAKFRKDGGVGWHVNPCV